LATMVSLPGSPFSVGQATVIFFYIGFWSWCVGPTLFFMNWNLLPSNSIRHKQHQTIVKNTNNSYLVIYYLNKISTATLVLPKFLKLEFLSLVYDIIIIIMS
jgi:hypothetical protein